MGDEMIWPEDSSGRLTNEQLVAVSLVVGLYALNGVVEQAMLELGLVKNISRTFWHPKVIQYQNWAKVVLNGKANTS